MGRDASLDEFLGDDGEGDEPDAEPEQPDEAEATEGDDAGRSTFAWSPDGAPCAACGDRVERRWRDDDRLVCESCKVW